MVHFARGASEHGYRFPVIFANLSFERDVVVVVVVVKDLLYRGHMLLFSWLLLTISTDGKGILINRHLNDNVRFFSWGGRGMVSREKKFPRVRDPGSSSTPLCFAVVSGCKQEVTKLIVDSEEVPLVSCTNATALRVEREVEIIFAGGSVSSDDTWLVFVSAPMSFLCSSWFMDERADPPTPGALGKWQKMPRFSLRAAEQVEFGVVRAALANNCTSGRSWVACAEPGKAGDKSSYADLLRKHAEVYPTGKARVAYSSSTLDWIEDALEVMHCSGAVSLLVVDESLGHFSPRQRFAKLSLGLRPHARRKF